MYVQKFRLRRLPSLYPWIKFGLISATCPSQQKQFFIVEDAPNIKKKWMIGDITSEIRVIKKSNIIDDIDFDNISDDFEDIKGLKK